MTNFHYKLGIAVSLWKTMDIIKKKSIIISVIVIVSALMHSCSILNQWNKEPSHHYTYIPYEKRLQKLNSINKWELRTNISIQYKNKISIISCYWQQNDKHYELNIFSPLNLVHFYVKGNERKATLWKSQKEKYSSYSPEQLLLDQIGWDAPISSLGHWVKNTPSPNIAINKIKFDHYDHIIMLEQNGWVIEYFNFVSQDGFDFPTKIILQNSRFKIKMIIKEWQILKYDSTI